MATAAPSTMCRRTVQYLWDRNDFTFFAEEASRAKLDAAIGYLSTWGSGCDRYAHCQISITGRPQDQQLLATYRAEDGGDVTFAMAGIWQDDEERFTFHS